ncbi:MAG: hypothetical protein HYR55_19340 [Acidobacteria bacterium]|nr:hypothetical protein [Acidobacteriota bacterium]MBI3656834.1 hypothetical protein [Acidobacteriota bacterium]
MKRIAFTLLFGLLVLGGSAFAQVDCNAGLSGCLFDLPTGGTAPAITFTMLADAVVHIDAGIWASPGCSGDPDATAVGDLSLPAGPMTVYINFTDPIPDGTPLSMIWTMGDCAATACIDYVMGSSPDRCPAGASEPATLDATLPL